MKPEYPGQIGDTTSDGTTTWLCMGGIMWVDHLEVETPPVEPYWPMGSHRRLSRRYPVEDMVGIGLWLVASCFAVMFLAMAWGSVARWLWISGAVACAVLSWIGIT